MENNIEKTGNWFVDQLSLYQNANNDNATVRRNFVVRVSEFELIMSDLRRKKTKDPLQHELLLGRRGSGKSTLLKRIQIEIEEDPTLNQHYIAINLAEEQAGIYRLSDLWFEALKEIALQTNTFVNLEAFSTFKDNQEYARYLHGEIHKILVEHQKKAVLLLDNLDRIVENFDDDGHLLRETLLNYNDLQIIGGSTRMDEHFWQYDKPFYEFFRRHRLEGLTFEEIHQLLNQWSEALALSQLKDYALHNRGKIEALRILTDGLPRTLQFFIKIFLKNSTLTGFDHIKQTMDLASPLYQERLNNLTAPQRKIVLEMAFIWEACSTKQLVEACRMEGKLISSFMKQLNGFGIVETLQTNTKNHLYRLSERFFNMWLIVTQGNPNQKRKARYLTIFLETWYDADEIRAMVKTHLQNLVLSY
jgi:energy-coupling factor transporter ATP-binding protein EcfA2